LSNTANQTSNEQGIAPENETQTVSACLTYAEWLKTAQVVEHFSWSSYDRGVYQVGHHFIYETTSWKGAYYYTSHCLPFGESTAEQLRYFGATLENIYDPDGYGAPFFKTLEDAFNFCNYYAANRNLLGGIEEEDLTRNLDTGKWELVQQRKAAT
jgi:hypothetical protein